MLSTCRRTSPAQSPLLIKALGTLALAPQVGLEPTVCGLEGRWQFHLLRRDWEGTHADPEPGPPLLEAPLLSQVSRTEAGVPYL